MPHSLDSGRTAVAALAVAALLGSGCAARRAEADPRESVRPASPSAVASPTRPVTIRTAALTASLRAYLATRPGAVAIAVKDLESGASYAFNRSLRTGTASIVKADIVATLVLRAAETGLTAGQKALATRMIEASDNDAATALWNEIGGGAGLAAGNRRLGLTQTRPGPGGAWGATETSAADQLKLVGAIMTDRSPLSEDGREYIQTLMSRVEQDQRWGVTAAAAEGDDVWVKNGWLPRPAQGDAWTVNSIGRVRGDDHDYLIAVISQGHPAMATGITTIEHVVKMVTQTLGQARPN
jgi:beta-lactamase class A